MLENPLNCSAGQISSLTSVRLLYANISSVLPVTNCYLSVLSPCVFLWWSRVNYRATWYHRKQIIGPKLLLPTFPEVIKSAAKTEVTRVCSGQTTFSLRRLLFASSVSLHWQLIRTIKVECTLLKQRTETILQPRSVFMHQTVQCRPYTLSNINIQGAPMVV